MSDTLLNYSIFRHILDWTMKDETLKMIFLPFEAYKLIESLVQRKHTSLFRNRSSTGQEDSYPKRSRPQSTQNRSNLAELSARNYRYSVAKFVDFTIKVCPEAVFVSKRNFVTGSRLGTVRITREMGLGCIAVNRATTMGRIMMVGLMMMMMMMIGIVTGSRL